MKKLVMIHLLMHREALIKTNHNQFKKAIILSLRTHAGTRQESLCICSVWLEYFNGLSQ